MKINRARCLALSTLGIGLFAVTSIFSNTIPLDPNTFLTMLERFVPEDDVSETAYYAAIDPAGKKTTYADWLVETGFINNVGEYSTTGAFTDHADVAVTHQNVADLGFIRRVRIRCEPTCEEPTDIYSVIENYPTFDDAAARTNRLASVTMEWTSAADGSRPSRNFVTFYAYKGNDDRNELSGDPFQPDLDGRGQKAIPGLCNTCHGGAPRTLTSAGTYRANGNTGGLFLPMDLDNFAFDPNPARHLSRAEQEAEYKKMNQVVLKTRLSKMVFDEVAGFNRLEAGHELIEGWYGGPGMPNATFDGEFVPAGWLEPLAPPEAEELYLKAVAPACRACHAQQKRELDFGTYDGFMVFEDAHKELVLSIECGLDDDGSGNDNQSVMPLAKETYEIFWATGQADVFIDHLGAVDCSAR